MLCVVFRWPLLSMCWIKGCVVSIAWRIWWVKRRECFCCNVVRAGFTIPVAESNIPTGISWHVPSVVAERESLPRCYGVISFCLPTRIRSSRFPQATRGGLPSHDGQGDRGVAHCPQCPWGTGMEINNSRCDSRTCMCAPCVCFEAAQEQKTGDVFVLCVEQVQCLHNPLKCILLLCV